MRKSEEIVFSWLIPAIAVLLPVAILLIGWTMNILGLNRRMVLPVFWVTFVTAPFIGVLTLMILFLQGKFESQWIKAADYSACCSVRNARCNFTYDIGSVDAGLD